MANILKPKRSNTAANVPTTSNLSSGEIAVNMADQKIYINNGTAVVQIGGGTLPSLNGVVIATPTSGQVLQYNGTNWINATSSGGSSNITAQGLYENSNTISANYTIGTGNNAMSAGPITVATGVTVTVPTGSAWTIV